MEIENYSYFKTMKKLLFEEFWLFSYSFSNREYILNQMESISF